MRTISLSGADNQAMRIYRRSFDERVFNKTPNLVTNQDALYTGKASNPDIGTAPFFVETAISSTVTSGVSQIFFTLFNAFALLDIVPTLTFIFERIGLNEKVN